MLIFGRSPLSPLSSEALIENYSDEWKAVLLIESGFFLIYETLLLRQRALIAYFGCMKMNLKNDITTINMQNRIGNGFMMHTMMPPIKMADEDDNHPDDPDVGVVTRTKPKTAKPKQYKVLLLNDDYTPMEFVVHVLRTFFQMDTDEATRVMLHVHQKGFGVCGIFTYEVAETKVTQVMDFARKNDHPLQCTLEKA